MGCCGLFSKSSKKSAAGGANGFAPRPVQQVVQGGQVGYAPTAAALDNQKKYNQEFRKQYGGDPNDPEFVRSLAANQALAGSAADCESPPSPFSPSVSCSVFLGVCGFFLWEVAFHVFDSVWGTLVVCCSGC